MPWAILDRDGVINEDSDAYIKSPEEWTPIPGSLEAIAQLNREGFRIAVITNQSGIARGLYDLETLALIHAKMRQALAQLGGEIAAIYACPHGPEDGCLCRKPRTGLYEQFAREHGVDLQGIAAVGDSLRDLQAAARVGADAILVMTGKGVRTLRRNPNLDLPTFANLHEASRYILFNHR
jgi:D-glycero-D-manno-heptose 1,7-bisphosphate phosphatase